MVEKGLAYFEKDYQQILSKFTYNQTTNEGKNQFVVNQDYYLSRLKGYQSYHSQTNYRDFYQNEIKQIENYDAGVYFFGMGASGYINNEIYPTDYLKGKRVLSQALSKQQLPPQSLRYGTSNWMFPLAVLNYLSSFWGIGGLIFVIGLPFLMKYEKNGIRLLVTQPFSRQKILMVDSWLVISRLVLAIVGTLSVSFVLGKIFGKDIPADYPILINLGGQYDTIPLYRYLLSTTCLLVLSICLIFLITQLLTMAVKNSVLALVLTMFCVGNGQIILTSHHEAVKQVAPYLAPLYVTPQKMFIGLDYQTQTAIEMFKTGNVPGDPIKGRESEFSFEERVDLSKGSASASRRKFFVAQFYPENSHYYAGKSFQGQIGPVLNTKNGLWVLTLNCFIIGGISLWLIQRKSF